MWPCDDSGAWGGRRSSSNRTLEALRGANNWANCARWLSENLRPVGEFLTRDTSRQTGILSVCFSLERRMHHNDHGEM